MIHEKLCTNCILPDTTPGISFDNKGICNYCNEYVPMKVMGEDALSGLLGKYRNPKKKYECMVCVSGGRDSTYTLWKIVNDYKMKTLALTYNSPFLSAYAKKNLEKAIGILGIDHLYWEYPKNDHLETTKKHLKIWAKSKSPKMIPFVCAHCKSWNYNFYNIAKDNSIPLIVFGSNPLETASFKKESFGGARTYGKISNLPKIFIKSLEELKQNPTYLKANWKLVFKMYLGASHSTPYMRYKYGDIEAVRLFDYIKWDEKMVESTIKKELNWEKSKEVESSWRFDCRLDYARRLLYHSTIGVTELRDLLSKMIRENIISRKEALQRIKKEEPMSKELVISILKELDTNLSTLKINIDDNLLY